ncbi:hypothetical protein X927_04315 [Petrotoga mexicana DSM 14811]|uniref:Uncharacterized protein n=1 Tax=Petrotoga mexicana DSM 14811 TaxID=1122954 RepID=A0A2K1PBV3_9BACT|nr:hypothetical protein X927_04315 [Petrotoga mexicana DSM 14811]
MGGQRGERTEETFPFGWAAGRRGAIKEVLEFLKAIKKIKTGGNSNDK